MRLKELKHAILDKKYAAEVAKGSLDFDLRIKNADTNECKFKFGKPQNRDTFPSPSIHWHYIAILFSSIFMFNFQFACFASSLSLNIFE